VRFVIALVAILLAGCGGDQPDATARLYGVVRIGPYPGPCDIPCSRPAGGVKLVFWRPGHDRIQTTTDERGRYEVEVEPGTYRIDAPRYRRPARFYPTRVKVVTDTQLNLGIDSGRL
jgi:hypothetical protein